MRSAPRWRRASASPGDRDAAGVSLDGGACRRHQPPSAADGAVSRVEARGSPLRVAAALQDGHLSERMSIDGLEPAQESTAQHVNAMLDVVASPPGSGRLAHALAAILEGAEIRPGGELGQITASIEQVKSVLSSRSGPSDTRGGSRRVTWRPRQQRRFRGRLLRAHRGRQPAHRHLIPPCETPPRP